MRNGWLSGRLVPSKMKISVCIVTYKRRAVLTHSLEKLFNSGMPEGEVLVVDNEAAPDLPSYLAELVGTIGADPFLAQ